ncbi:hypothetical protein EGY08_22595 [Klebsiella sp. FDAARGOS_511]|nr:hypothetical protein EGY08_22595 [Klebsiella sp. FDAARGOS_511]
MHLIKIPLLCKWFFNALPYGSGNMNYLHHKPENKSVDNCRSFIAQSLVLCGANRLRKILCQDLLSQNDSVILWAVVQSDRLLRPKFYC